jgi:HYR domain-containing protein
MKRQILLLTFALGCATLPDTGTSAPSTPNYQLSWTTMDIGGASSTGGRSYSASSSVGQLNSGPLTTGPYTLAAGFFTGTDPGQTNDPCTRLQITSQPVSITNRCESDCVTFSVGVIGSTPISAQWYFNGDPIPGATGLFYSICPVKAADQGIYSVSLSNACSRVDSERVLLVLELDVTPPVITCPSNIVVWTCDPNGGPVIYPMPTVTDDYDATPTVFCMPPSGSIFPVGTTTVICEAFDDCRNRSRCEFMVRVVQDTTPPVLVCSNITVCASSSRGAVVNYMPTATDDCSSVITIKCDPEPGSLFPLGVTEVVCEATDECGNSSRCEFKVEVVRAKLSIARTHLGVVITWDCGTLEEADSVDGTWTALGSATSPYAVSAVAPKKFYRLRDQ